MAYTDTLEEAARYRRLHTAAVLVPSEVVQDELAAHDDPVMWLGLHWEDLGLPRSGRITAKHMDIVNLCWWLYVYDESFEGTEPLQEVPIFCEVVW